MLVHHCAACETNTPVPISASTGSPEHYCQRCGAPTPGAVLRVPAIESNLNRKLEQRASRDMQQDELARMFAQNMSFAPPPPPPASSLTPPPEPPAYSLQTSKSSEPMTYITRHYTHSAHVAIAPQPREISPAPSASSPPLVRAQLEHVLQRNSIDPGLLFPSQLTLFQRADADQRLRLLELWRICPPTLAEHERAWESGAWPETSLLQEEAMARSRYERMALLQQQDDGEDSMSGYNYNRAGGLPAAPTATSPRTAEPYMLSGYEALARRDYETAARQHQHQQHMALQETTRYNQATDPAYFKPAGYIKADADGSGHQDMENQYGAFQAMRQTEVIAPADDGMVM